jgi:acetoacetate decarboxylase
MAVTAGPEKVAGKLDFSRTKPLGMPSLAPLYGMGPYQYRGNICVIVVAHAAEAAIREVLPAELEPLASNTVAWCLFVCPDVTGMGPHSFAMPCIACRYGDFAGQFVPYLYTSTEQSLACYREVQGWPARLGRVTIDEAGGKVRASVYREGRELIKASGEVGGDRITQMEFLPIILYKEIPGLDGRTRDVARLITSTSLLENLDFRAGAGSFAFDERSDDPVTRLAPTKPVQLLYGTLDDFYPETIRVLHQY